MVVVTELVFFLEEVVVVTGVVFFLEEVVVVIGFGFFLEEVLMSKLEFFLEAMVVLI